MNDVSPRIQRRSLAEEVSDRLRHDILSGVFQPGERLVVQMLERRYGVSHIPIREALRSLEAESLVTSRRGSGAVVAGVGIEELHDLYELRRLVEEHVLRRAILHYDREVLHDAARQFEHLHGLVPTHGDNAWWHAHRDFHWTLLQPGLTPWTDRVLRLIWQSVERYQRLYTLVFGDVHIADVEHQHILDVARQGDADALVQRWIDHLNEKEARVAEGFSHLS